MIRHYFKIIFRTILRSKIYTLINITGLSTGMVVFILIMLYVNYEFSVDGYHENKDRIYRIAKQDIGHMYLGDDRFAVTMAPLGPTVKAEFPEVERSARVARGWNVLIRTGENTHLESIVYGIDPDAFDMFTFEYLPASIFREIKKAVERGVKIFMLATKKDNLKLMKKVKNIGVEVRSIRLNIPPKIMIIPNDSIRTN